MNIAFYAPLKAPDHPVPSGDRHMARMLWEALAAAGYSVRLASRFRSWEGRGDGVRQQRLRRVGERLAGRLVRRWRSAPEAVRPQVWFTYHLYHKAPDWLGPAVSGALGIPYVVAEPSHATRQLDGPWSEGCRSAERALLAADALVVVNGNDLEALLGMPIDEDRIHRLPPFLDAERYRCGNGSEIRRRVASIWGLNDHLPLLLAVGMLRPGDKLASYSLLADTLAGLLDLPWQLLVIGDGAAREQVVARLRSRVPDRYRLIGQASEAVIRECLCASDLMVWPAVNEAYGIALLEAQAAGLPVVAADVGGVGEVVAHEVSGLLAPAGDCPTLAAHVRRLLLDPQTRERFGRAARDRVRAQHDTAGAARALGAILAGLGVVPESEGRAPCPGW